MMADGDSMLGTELRHLRKLRGVSQKELAEVLKVTPGAISRWENNTANPSHDCLLNLAKYFNVSLDDLIGSDDTLKRLSIIKYDKKHKIPVLGKVSAGMPMYAEENISGYIMADFPDMDDEQYFGLQVHGDSMNAAGINNGDIVVVRQQPMVDDGQIAVVLVDNDEATIKKFSHNGNLVILAPQSLNPAHQIQIYDIRKTQIKVLGLAVEIRRAL